MARRGLQVVVTFLGCVALGAGLLTLITGGALVPDAGDVSASMDSELRFHAAWYAAAGVLLLRVAPRVESETAKLRAICAVLFIAACARVVSIVVVGVPHPLFVTLMVIEFAIPVVVLPWQAAIARRA
jgi:peptidoglycan/LPS O-acetylase OafA/YrhL